MRVSQRWWETTRCAARAGGAARRRARWLVGALLSLLFGLVLGALAPAAAAADAPAFTTTPAATTNDTTPSWAGTLPTGATAECTLTRPDGSTSAVACDDGVGGFAATVAADTDGVYTFTVVAVSDDGAGGTVASVPVDSSTTVDTEPPSVAIVTEPASPGTDRTPTWEVAAEPGASATCRLTAPGFTSTATSCSGAWSADLTRAGEAVYVLTVTATDDAGNTASVSGAGYELLLPPATPTVTPPPSPGNDPSVSWAFPVPSGATATCSLRAPDGSTLIPAGSCTSPWATSLSAGDGTYTAAVVLTDSGGSSEPGTASAVLDTVAPGATTVTGTSGRTTNPSVSWSFATGDSTGLCRLEQDGALGAEAPCTSPWTGPLGSDGTYRLAVVLIDPAGNRSPTAWGPAVTLDRAAPATPTITSAPTSPNNGGATRSFTWNHTVVETTQCRVTTGSTVVRGWATCTGSYQFDVSTLADGVYQFEVRSLDDLGNTSGVATSAVQLDATAPTAPTVTAPSGPSSSRTWTVDWQGEPGAVGTCVLVRGGVVLASVTPCADPWDADLSGQPDGTYTARITVTDAAGNQSLATSVSYTLDTTAPAVPTFTVEPAPSPSTTPRWEFGSDSGATLLCTLTAPDGSVLSDGVCTSPFVPDLGAGADGTYTLAVRARDAAGNTSAAATSTYLLDTAAPAAPVLSAESGPSNDRTWLVGWTAETGSTATCTLLSGATVVRAATACASPHAFDLAGLADGGYTASVTVTDAAGNVSSASTVSYSLDTTPPSVPGFAVTPPPTASTRAPRWEFSSDAGATLLCRLIAPDGTVRVDGACTSPFVPDLTGGADGTYTLEVRARDEVGNLSAAAVSRYLLDTVAPAVPVFTAEPATSADLTPEWSVTVDADAVLLCRLTAPDGTAAFDGTCASPYAPDLTGGPDGDWTLEVRARDAAGNVSAAAVSGYALDTAAPAAPVVTAPTGPSSSRSWQVSWSGEAGTTATCELSRDGVVARTVVGCTSPYPVDLTGLPDGTWTLSVRLTDAAGNAGGAGTARYALDTTPPAVPTFTAEPSTSYERTPTWEFRSDPGSTLLCRLVAPDGTVLVDGICTSPLTQNLSGRPDGDYVLEVRARDAVGNVSAPARSVFVLDTVAPADPSVVRAPAPSADRTPTWELSAPSDAVLLCRLTAPDGSMWSDGVCSPTFTPDLTDGADGGWTLAVTARDEAGNLSGTVSSTYLLDTVAPADPVFTREPATSPDRSPTWTFSGEPGASLTCRLLASNGTLLDAVTCSGSYTADLTGLADGTYRLEVRAVDVAGNMSGWSVSTFVLDTAAPAAVAVTAPASPGNVRAPRWSFTAEAAATIECRTGSGTWQVCGSELVLDLSTAADGTYAVEARAVDAAGNVGPVVRSEYVLDTTAPAAAGFTSEPPTSFERTPRWSFTGEAGATLLCRLTGPTGSVLLDAACSSPLTADLTGQPDGTYTLRVLVRDAAGNVSAAATSTFILDTAAPAAPVVTAPATPGNTRTPVWGIASTGTNSCRLLSGGVVLEGWAACGTSHTADLGGRPDGTYVLEVRTRDAAGNVSSTTSSSYRLDTAPPPAPGVVASSSPSSGASPTWTVTSTEPGTTAACRVRRDGILVRDWAPCTATTTGAPFSLDLSGLPDGSYRLEVRLTDAAGNTGAIAGATYVYDTTPPAPVVVTAPASPGSTRSPTWRFAPEPGARLECRLGDSGAYTACGAELVVDLSAAPDGTYAVWVRAIDVAGNVGSGTRTAYALDTRAPAAPVLGVPTSPSAETAPEWTWTGETGATARCELTHDGVRVLTEACASPWAPTLGSDGTWTLTVRLVDAAGNVSPPAGTSYVLDTTAPDAPVVAGPGSPNSLTNPTFSFTAESGALLQCRLSYARGAGRYVPLADWQGCTSPASWSTRDPGSYLVEVRAVDRAGNVSAVTGFGYEYDPDAPAGLRELTPAASPSTERLPVWTFAAADGAVVTCRLVGPTGEVLLDAPCSGSVTPPEALSVDGVYRLTITVRDGLGNVGVNAVLYELDTTGPAAPVVAPSAEVGQDGTVSWSWTGDPGATWRCRLTFNGVVVRDWRDCTPYRQALVWGEGGYVLDVRGDDALGNVGRIGRGSYTWDVTAPAAVTLVSASGSAGTARRVTWTFQPPDDAVAVTCAVRSGRTLIGTPTGCGSGSYVMDLRSVDVGRYDLVVLLTDRAGNTRELTASYTLLAVAGPAPAPPAPKPPPKPVPGTGRPPATAPGPAAVLPRPAPAIDPTAPTAVSLGRALRDDDVPARGAAVVGSGMSAGDSGQPAGETTASSDAPFVRGAEPALGLPSGPVSGARAVEALKDVAGETIRRPTLPIALLLVVGLFLLVQNRIDRRDPKLAGAAVDEEPDLEFRTFRPGGATA